MIKVLKAMLRDWLFKDYKWITRAEVVHIICAEQWKYRNYHLVQRILSDIREQLK